MRLIGGRRFGAMFVLSCAVLLVTRGGGGGSGRGDGGTSPPIPPQDSPIEADARTEGRFSGSSNGDFDARLMVAAPGVAIGCTTGLPGRSDFRITGQVRLAV